MADAPIPTSGFKADAGKARFDLIPSKPLFALAQLFTLGSTKYSARNWERGMRFGRVFAAMMRHAWAWWGGEDHDPIDGQHHLTSVQWCAMTLQELCDTHPECDDRPKPTAPNEAVVAEIAAEVVKDPTKTFVR